MNEKPAKTLHIFTTTATLGLKEQINMKKKIILLTVLLSAFIVLPAQIASANMGSSSSSSSSSSKSTSGSGGSGGSGDTQPQGKPPSPLTCGFLPQNLCASVVTDVTKSSGNTAVDAKKTGIFMFLVMAVRILTGIVGIAAVGALVYAGILYSSAGGTSDRISKAKTIIFDTVIGVIAYALMFIVLNWLIPGGVLS